MWTTWRAHAGLRFLASAVRWRTPLLEVGHDVPALLAHGLVQRSVAPPARRHGMLWSSDA